MEGASYFRCKICLRGFLAALLSVTEMVNETWMGPISVTFPLFLLLCPIFICVHFSGVFQEHTQPFLLIKS